ncbi:MAG: FAD-dependent oxidoreductase, partial [Gammaproteobacteria bacterium]
MPADDVEIIEGNEEGVKLHPSLGPKEIHLDDQGHVRAVSFKRVLSVFDEDGKFAPKFDENDITKIEAEIVLWAVGQQADLSFLEPEKSGVNLNERGNIIIDPVTQQSSASDVFVAGDVAHGLGLMIDAIASGKRVARSINKFLSGTTLVAETDGKHTALTDFTREKDYEKLERLHAPTASVEDRAVSQSMEVEKDYSGHEDACRQASRCLDCGINTIFDSSKCLLCGGCVDVCPENCLQIVTVSRLLADGETQVVLDRLCGETPPEEASAIIKDEARCIRCVQCAERCPVGAITMEQFSFKGKWNAK